MNHSGSGSSYSARNRSRSKQPIYTSDKRAKFTQRENKKWMRLVTVLGYVVCVSAPAVSLSFYYTHVWDPDYIKKLNGLQFPPGTNVTESLPIYKSPIQPKRNTRDAPFTKPGLSVAEKREDKLCTCSPSPQAAPPVSHLPLPSASVTLFDILHNNGGSASLESSESLELSSDSSEEVDPLKPSSPSQKDIFH